MRKNILMRIGSTALVLTMITSYIISGTYAKYITTKTVNDSARVAKFGVTVTASGSLFSKNYFNVDNGNTAISNATNISVKSSDTVKVVAPGTKSSTTGIAFSVKGTSETDVKVLFNATSTKDIFLKADKYTDYTGKSANFTLDNDYHPVVFTLKNGATTEKTGTITEIVTYLNSLTQNSVTAGTNLSTTFGDYTLTWEWAYGDTGITVTGNDQADTLLGRLAADSSLVADSTKFSTEIDFDLKITVVQID